LRIWNSVPSRLPAVVRIAYGPGMALGILALAAAAVAGVEELAVAGLGLTVAIESAAVYAGPRLPETLAKAGFRPRTRALQRSLVAAVAVGVAADGRPAPLILYGLVATATHIAAIGCNTLIGWVLARAPAFGVRNVGADLDLRRRFERAKANRPAVPYVFLAVEWLVLTGLAVTMDGPAASRIAVAAAGLAAIGSASALAALWAYRLIRGGGIGDYDRRLLHDLHELDPEVIVYMSAGAGQSGYILNQWLPALAAMSRRGMILVREESNLAPIGSTALPVVYAPAIRDVERFVLPGAKVAIYMANSGRNVHLLREPAIKHVFINHGDSDKATSANPVSRVYDEVWVAGQTAIDRYGAAGVKIPSERFAVIGRPQVDGLPVGPRKDREPTRVLYAPTWEGLFEEVNYSSLEVAGAQMIGAVLRERPDVAVIFKPHPATGSWRREMRAAQRRVERLLRQSPDRERHIVVTAESALSLNDCLAMSDVLISDISSVVTDFLHTERPIIVSNPLGLEWDAFRQMFPTQRASYVIGPDFGALVAILGVALGEDPLARARRKMKRQVLGDLPDGPLRAFDRNVDRICDVAARDAEALRNTFMLSPADVARAKAGRPRSSSP
jgi:hypothetical protein